MGLKGSFWQRFVYKNLDGICLWCGHFHHLKELCLVGGGGGEGTRLGPENVVPIEGETRGAGKGGP